MAAAEDKPLGKREARRAEVRALHNEGKTPAEIGKALKPRVTEAAVRQLLKKMELTPNAPGAARPGALEVPQPEGGVTAEQLVQFLTEIGARVRALGAGSYELEGKSADLVGLLEYANAWRRRHRQQPFTLKRG